MEDATCVVNALPDPLEHQALFAVFDGHGGDQVSLIASKDFPKVLTHSMNNLSLGAKGSAEVLKKALTLTMLQLDDHLRQQGTGWTTKPSGGVGPQTQHLMNIDAECRNAYDLIGSTAIVVLMDCEERTGPRRLTVANLGDSRAVLCRKGVCKELSRDHKPENPEEEARIRRAGGRVAAMGPCYRVDGGLNLSRALGDFHYKARPDLGAGDQKVCAEPEVLSLELEEDDEFLVLGCDGVFELLRSQEVVDVVRRQLQQGRPVDEAVEHLIDRCVSPTYTRGKGGDNCSAIIVKLNK